MARVTAWVGPEEGAKRRLAADLRPFLALTRLAHGFAERALRLRAASPLDGPSRVQAQLLAQASNQLRIIELAAERGYALQALGAAATLYEHVSALAYVDGDPAKARRWLKHTTLDNTYPPSKKRATGIRSMLAASGVPPREIQPLVASWEDLHTRFCAAKHGNPILLRKYGVSWSKRQLVLHLGPIVGPECTLISRMALYHGSRLLADASVLIATPALSSSKPDVSRFDQARVRLLRRMNHLAFVRTLGTRADSGRSAASRTPTGASRPGTPTVRSF